MLKPFTLHNKQLKILKEMKLLDHLTCLLRNLYAAHEATVRTGHGTTEWFQIGKGVHQACILSLCSFNLFSDYTMRNAGLGEAQTGIKIAWRIPGTEEPSGLPSMGLHRVGHNGSDLAAAATLHIS